ncbi:hypothetical protein MVES1_001947 [Malassezia vespertilionis]|uniref:uncharacterized protein n=1 Tax=Malassezia vespertilionis TaxID=2020962 RepID=UPI0024B1B1A1|nr:uncharacterized protein MVES1_001947 [Malassezia vespertilionis]WFD06594.1 hypothetical protein MVES1_001947 [Malassezia vespertilionis]
MAEPIVDDGPLASYLADIAKKGKEHDNPLGKVPAVPAPSRPHWRNALQHGLALLRVQLVQSMPEAALLDAHARKSAHDHAWCADDGAALFAERLKYAVATSFLLTSQLSISMYGQDKEQKKQKHMPSHTMTKHTDDRYAVQASIADPVPMLMLGAAVAVVLGCIALHIPFPVMLLCLVALDATTTFFPHVPSALRGPRTMRFSLSQTPDSARPRYLAAGEPTPSWVVDERLRLQEETLLCTERLIAAAYALDRTMNACIAAIQEVELVSRGYSLSSPLPPISRLESLYTLSTSTSEMLSSAELHASPSRIHSAVYPQRLTVLRKTLLDTLETITYHSIAARDILVPLCYAADTETIEELSELRKKSRMEPTTTWTSVRAPGNTTPRMRSLFAQATPPNRGANTRQCIPLASPVTPSRNSPDIHTHRASSTDTHARQMMHGSGSDTEETCAVHTPSKLAAEMRRDRLSLACLKAKFEHMHLVRRSMLYHFLALDFTMQSPVTIYRVEGHPEQVSLTAYWDSTVVRRVLQPLAQVMEESATHLRTLLEHSMGETLGMDDAVLPDTNGAAFLHQHLGLTDRMAEMGRTLRTVQCKLRACVEDLAIPPPPALHGVGHEMRYVQKGSDVRQTQRTFDSIRNDLLAMSSEWEAALRIMEMANAPPQPKTPKTPPQPKTPCQDSGPDTDDCTDAAVFKTDKKYSLDNLSLIQLLVDSTSPDSLPMPGDEEVFESTTQAKPARSVLPRAERIRIMQEQRTNQLFTQTKDPAVMVTELKDVLSLRRVHATARDDSR